MLGQLSWEDEADGGLDLATGEGGFLVVRAQLAGLTGDLAEDIVDERVHDGHTFFGHAGVRVDLLEDLVDVDRERFSAATAAFLARCSFGSFFSHDENKKLTAKTEEEREERE